MELPIINSINANTASPMAPLPCRAGLDPHCRDHHRGRDVAGDEPHRVGMLIRAGVDDREMLAASGVRIQLVFLAVFGFGAGLAGMAGIIGGTFSRCRLARIRASCSPASSW